MTTAPDWQPTLTGRGILLRPLRPEDLDALHAAAADPGIWAQHPEPDRHERAAFERYFHGALASGGALVATELATGRVIGSSRYYDWSCAEREVAIGYTFLVRDHWGGASNGEMKRLMLEHAFRWARTVWFHVGPGNMRSRTALERIGAVLHGSTGSPGDPRNTRLVYRIDRPPRSTD
jgi:N-acetyltransferase